MTQAVPAQRAAAATDPLRRAANLALTPGQTTALPFESRAVLLGLGGDLSVTLAGGDSLTLPALREGVLYPLALTQIHDAGTTASQITVLA